MPVNLIFVSGASPVLLPIFLALLIAITFVIHWSLASVHMKKM
jgi:hypothetical protein